jgi:hypothetical protein
VTFTLEQVMMTLAGIAYRGFHDVLPGERHAVNVRRAVQEGLDTLEPVRGDWELVWGPVTSRVPLAARDSNAMYVVRSRRERHRYVVALRGTNPVSSSDWLFGDFLVSTTVRWPFTTDGAAISTSTGLGLVTLQQMRAGPPGTAGGFAQAALGAVGGVVQGLGQAGSAAVSAAGELEGATPAALVKQVERILAAWSLGGQTGDRGKGAVSLEPAAFRRRLLPPESRRDGLDLLTFLRTQADESRDALDVTITGHSKGGTLAATVALWLQVALESPDDGECWDPTRRARVSCYTYSGPTPGNGAFARQVEQKLGARQHHFRNLHDMSPLAWQVDTLQRVPGLYGRRSAVMKPVVSAFLESVRTLDYRHAEVGVVPFPGKLDPERVLPHEMIHQHFDAYLAELRLLERGISAVDFLI